MMLSQIKNAFPQSELNHCIIALADSEFKILDKDEQAPASIHTEGSFQVLNPSQKEIHFLAIDKCIFFDSDNLKKCDAAVFDTNIFYFIEIKNIHKLARRSEARKNAKEQLLSTIKIFKERIDFSAYSLLAVYSLTDSNTKPYPAKTASQLNTEIRFIDLDTTLLEGNQIEI